MNPEWLVVDGLQYSAWSREIFEQMREGGLDAVHVTIAYHENTRETLTRLGEWNQRFESYPDLIRPVYQPADIAKAKAEGRVGINGLSRASDGFQGRSFCAVGHVDDHPHAIHLSDHLFAKSREAAVLLLVTTAG